MPKPLTFPYFRDPHNFSSYVETPEECGVCGKERPGYSGTFYGEGDLDFICEPCLASGGLAELDLFTNQADRSALTRQIRAAHPNLPDNRIEQLVDEKSSAIEERTPSVITWQDFEWPAHCQDYMCFIKEAGKPDLNSLSPGGDGRTFFQDHLYNDPATDIDHVWGSIRTDSPSNLDQSYSTAVYLFQCLHCHEYTVLWDCD